MHTSFITLEGRFLFCFININFLIFCLLFHCQKMAKFLCVRRFKIVFQILVLFLIYFGLIRNVLMPIVYSESVIHKADDVSATNQTQHSATMTKRLGGNVRARKNIFTQGEFCGIFSPWNSSLVYSSEPSNLSHWDFKRKEKCPWMDLTNFPLSRQKVVLDCTAEPTITLEAAKNAADVFEVNFGDKCLTKVIESCCSDDKPVPNVVHYVWFGGNPLGYFQFLSYISVVRFLKPCLFLFHGDSMPFGPYWDFFISHNPNVIFIKRELVSSLYGHSLRFKEHGSDVMRIEALQQYGGIYLDWDEVLLRPLEPLRKYEYTQGKASPKHFGSQVIMAKRNATFLNLWHQAYKNYSKEWGANALVVPFQLSQKYPDLVHVEGFNFTRPFPNILFTHNYDWSTNYGMHLFIRFYQKKTDVNIIRKLNTTIGAISRHILLGNKELCSN